MFYVKAAVLAKLTGRSAQDIGGLKNNGKLPWDTNSSGNVILDIDDPVVAEFMNKPPRKSRTPEQIRHTEAYRKDFEAKRRAGQVVCEKLGEVDMFNVTGVELKSFLDTATSDTVDMVLKKKEAEYKDKRNIKLDAQIDILRAGLIERSYVDSYMARYLGSLHNQFLNRAATGLGERLYLLTQTEPDERSAIAKINKLLGDDASDKIKAAKKAMTQNPL